MDHDLLLDLSHLDDPEPPRFGALRAEEATRLAGRNQARRARLLAGAVLAVVLLAGVTVAGVRSGGSTSVNTALPSAETVPEDTIPASTTVPPTDTPTTATAAPAEPAPTLPAPSTTPAPTAPGPGSGPSTLPGPAAGAPKPSVPPPATATGQPPENTVPAPAGLRFTLTIDAAQVTAGGSVRGRTRLENTRSTAVTVGGGGCSSDAMWRPRLYEAGKLAAPQEVDCAMAVRKEIGPGAVVQTEVELFVGSGLRAGTYDAFSVVAIDGEAVGFHSERVQITVVRP